MAQNMKLIETKTLTSNQSSVVFTAIPQTYTDLLLIISARTNGAFLADSLYVTMNSSTSNFSWENLYGRGNATAISQNNTNNQLASAINGANSTVTTFSNLEIYIPNYRNTAHNKSITNQGSTENNGAVGDNNIDAVLWNDTSSITSMTLAPIPGGSFVTHSTFYLYGITSTSADAKATGGIITDDANYFYHTFFSTGTFTPSQSLTCDYLVVAGGGGGGSEAGGGGGAGGYRTSIGGSALSLIATPYTVTVGGGGAGASSNTVKGSNGTNSTLSTITSTGGGGGGSGGIAGVYQGNTGGSGGGSRSNTSTSGAAGNQGGFSPVEGYAGGGSPTASTGSGGGGGAGGVGLTGLNTRQGGNGGLAIANLITGTAIYYAGGGGGGTNVANNDARGLGGSTSIVSEKGGAGDGGVGVGGGSTSGTENTGGGGGGEAGTAVGNPGNGGSGIVIVRYAK